jgi:hypothetical protein
MPGEPENQLLLTRAALSTRCAQEQIPTGAFCRLLVLAVLLPLALFGETVPLPLHWWSRGAGGGGAFFSPSLSPLDPGTLYISTDMGTMGPPRSIKGSMHATGAQAAGASARTGSAHWTLWLSSARRLAARISFMPRGKASIPAGPPSTSPPTAAGAGKRFTCHPLI